MKSRFGIAILAVIGLFVIGGATAVAAEFTSVQSGNWCDRATWGNGASDSSCVASVAGTDYPNTADTALISFYDSVTITATAGAGYLAMRPGARLTTGAFTLTLDGDGGGTPTDGVLDIRPGAILTVANGGKVDITAVGESVIDGLVKLAGGGNNSILEISANHAIGGSGRLQGLQATQALINIDSGKRFTNRLDRIEGALTIDRPSGADPTYFRNDRVVQADNPEADNYVITVKNLTVEGSGEFRIGAVTDTDSTDEINFHSSVSMLQYNGPIVVLHGKLNVDCDVVTAERLYFRDGSIEVAANKTFIAN